MVQVVQKALSYHIPIVKLSFITTWVSSGRRPDHVRHSSLPDSVLESVVPRGGDLQRMSSTVKRHVLRFLTYMDRLQLRGTCLSWYKFLVHRSRQLRLTGNLSLKRSRRVSQVFKRVQHVQAKIEAPTAHRVFNTVAPIRHLTSLDVSGASGVGSCHMRCTVSQLGPCAPRLNRVRVDSLSALQGASLPLSS